MSILVRVNEKINLNILKQNRLYISNTRALYDIQLYHSWNIHEYSRSFIEPQFAQDTQSVDAEMTS